VNLTSREDDGSTCFSRWAAPTRHASLLVGLVALGIPGLGPGATDEGARLSLPPSEWMAKGEAAVLAVPSRIYATSASFGRLV
jgi:hypothetical protein